MRQVLPNTTSSAGCNVALNGSLSARRQMNHDPSHHARENHGDEAGPDHAARARIAVHLRQHVAEDVADRKKDVARAEYERGADERQCELADLRGADQIRAEQDRDEAREDEVVVAVTARADGTLRFGCFQLSLPR